MNTRGDISVKVPEPLYRAIREQAAREERTIIAVLGRAVRAYIEKEAK
jgi:hypothetical protein